MVFDEQINMMQQSIIASAQDLVRIKSVKEASRPGAPFGEGVNNALLFVLNLAAAMGFKTKYIDGYIGYAEFGDGEEIVGILGHLDVVPEGSGWLFPPFEAHIHENKIFGRGAIDNKGPIIAALYALKALKDSNAVINKRVRIIFGTDEENGWADIEKYYQIEEQPTVGFTPDGMFPVINVEKGSIDIQLSKEIVRKSKGMIVLKSLAGGEAANIVPNLSTCELKLKDIAKVMFRDTLELYCEKNNVNLTLHEDNDVDTIISRGLSCHSSIPQKGKNAINQLIMFLNQFNIGQNDVSDFLKFLSKYIVADFHGKNLGISCQDEITGDLTVSLGKVSISEDSAAAVLNIRYPVSADFEIIMDKIKKSAEDKKIDITVLKHKQPLYIEKESKLVSTLMDVYKEVTGNNSYAIAIGGQTYAKAFKNIVAFGPVFPGEDSSAHMPNEYIHIDNLIKCVKIYIRAIYELAK